MFELIATFSPSGDQPKAIEKLVKVIQQGKKEQVLLGATGTGKTFTMANVIQQVQRSTLILVHNKTLAMQIYSEMKTFFPHNKVEYYVSYFDYYQPEAYKPTTDTYIAKKTQRNEHISKMRLQALNSLVTSEDVIVVASVAAIYGAFNPAAYRKAVYHLTKGQKISKEKIIKNFSRLGYKEKKKLLTYGGWQQKENNFTFMLTWEETYYFQLNIIKGKLISIEKYRAVDKEEVEQLINIAIPPAQEYVLEEEKEMSTISRAIKKELEEHLISLKEAGKYLEAQRLEKKVNEDLLNLNEFGVCPGIENYARYFDERQPGECPFVLLDYFPRDYLVFIDESHITIPQVKAMYNTDRSRKLTLVKYGFRLPSAMDNRPLDFSEFLIKAGTKL